MTRSQSNPLVGWLIGSLIFHVAMALVIPARPSQAMLNAPQMSVVLAAPGLSETTSKPVPDGPAETKARSDDGEQEPKRVTRVREQSDSPSAAKRIDRAHDSQQTAAKTIAPKPIEVPVSGVENLSASNKAVASGATWGMSFASAAGRAASTLEHFCTSESDGPAAPQPVGSALGTTEFDSESANEGTGHIAPEAPSPLDRTRPKYPVEAREQGQEGVVDLRLRVNEAGAVEKVVVVKSSGHGLLDSAAEEGARKWLFRPAHRGKASIAAWVDVSIIFEIEDYR